MAEKVKKFKTLYKKASDGVKIIEWDISVIPNKNKTATIKTVYGQKGGKKQTIEEVIKEGKNKGRSNETTPLQQAINEAQSRWNVKATRHKYSEDINKCGEARSKAPMLAYVYEDHAKKVDWDTAYVQPKLDGFRCIATCTKTADTGGWGGEVVLKSREGKPIESMWHIQWQLAQVMRAGEVLDGELYMHGLTFQQLASLIRRRQNQSLRVGYHVYDVPLDKPFTKRLAARDAIQDKLDKCKRIADYRKNTYDTTKMGRIVAVQTRIVTGVDQLMSFQRKMIERGYEGAMLRHGNLPYEFGKRSKSLLKVKTFRDAEFMITDIREGRGKCAGMCVFICQTEKGAEFEVFAPGTAAEKRSIWENRQSYVGQKLTVKYQEMTTSENPVPRFPVALRLQEIL